LTGHENEWHAWNQCKQWKHFADRGFTANNADMAYIGQVAGRRIGFCLRPWKSTKGRRNEEERMGELGIHDY
jgi:hypothetical protein